MRIVMGNSVGGDSAPDRGVMDKSVGANIATDRGVMDNPGGGSIADGFAAQGNDNNPVRRAVAIGAVLCVVTCSYNVAAATSDMRL